MQPFKARLSALRHDPNLPARQPSWHLLASLALGLGCGLAAAKGPGAHQHGVAKLEVVLDDKLLQLNLESPLDNLLGFERGPRTETERQAVRTMARRFHAGADLFVPTAAAGCTLQGSELVSGVIDASLLAAPGAAAATAPANAAPAPTAAKANAQIHADLDATVRFLCAQPAALKGVEVRLFQAFPRLRQLDTALATGKLQRGTQLTPKQTMLSF